MVISRSEVALGPVVACARVLVHEVSRTEDLAKRRRAHSADDAGLEEHRAWYVLATRGFVVKHVDAVELRVVVAAVLAVAPNAVRSCAKKKPGGVEHAAEKGRGGAEQRKKLLVAVWNGKQEMPVVRSRVSRTGK